MHQLKITTAVAAILCMAPIAFSHAQSNTELFSLYSNDQTFDDGKGVTTGNLAGLSYEVIAGHAIAEGDMVLGPVDGRGNVLGSSNRGLGQSRLLDRWDNGIIPYQFSSDISVDERALADQAIEHWTSNTSIVMVEVTDENREEFDNFILFESSNGCASYVGMRGGEQQLWISASCGVGSIIHEIGHAVGLFHEHTRADRGNFINVQWDNIVPGKEFNFDVLNANVTTLGEYDYGSIMHYGERFFSSNNENTITVLDGVSQIGQRNALSEIDIQSVNEMYATDLALRVDATSAAIPDQINANINVSNQGELGANGLSLKLELGDGGTWLATSPNPGWECSADGAVLNCDRDTLEADVTSLFTVAAQTSDASARSLSVQLNSNSFDTDYSNNGHNATVTQDSANEPDSQAATPVEEQSTGGAFNQPTVEQVEAQIDEQNANTIQPVDVPAVNNTVEPVEATRPEVGTEEPETLAAPVTTEPAEQANTDSQIVQQPAQQSSQPITVTGTEQSATVEAEATVTASEPGAPAQALPEAELAAATPSSSSGGGAFSPLGAAVLFLLTFVARARREPAR